MSILSVKLKSFSSSDLTFRLILIFFVGKTLILFRQVKDLLIFRCNIFCKHRFPVTIKVSDGTGSGLNHRENIFRAIGIGVMGEFIAVESASAVMRKNHAVRTAGIIPSEINPTASHDTFRHIQFGGRFRDTGCLENGLRSPAFSAIVIELVRCPVSIQ